MKPPTSNPKSRDRARRRRNGAQTGSRPFGQPRCVAAMTTAPFFLEPTSRVLSDLSILKTSSVGKPPSAAHSIDAQEYPRPLADLERRQSRQFSCRLYHPPLSIGCGRPSTERRKPAYKSNQNGMGFTMPEGKPHRRTQRRTLRTVFPEARKDRPFRFRNLRMNKASSSEAVE